VISSKTYTFFPDTNPFFCVIAHVLGLATHSNAFNSLGSLQITTEAILACRVPGSKDRQPILWKDEVKEHYLFLNPGETSGCDRLPYTRYHG